MWDQSFGFLTVNTLSLVLSMLAIFAIPLGILTLVFGIGKWKTSMGLLPRFRVYDE